MAYRLTERQIRGYTDTATIRRPANEVKPLGSVFAEDPKWEATTIHEGVPCRRVPRPEASAPGALGRTNQDMIFTLDAFEFPIGIEVDDSYEIELTTAGHPEQGAVFTAMGGPSVYPSTPGRDTNRIVVLAKRGSPHARAA